jgi:dihydroorotase
VNIQIKNGRLIDPANAVDEITDLFIQDNKVAAIARAPAGFKAALVIDAENSIVCPGLVDIRARKQHCVSRAG